MTKFMKKLTGLALGLALITGVGVGVSAKSNNIIKVDATDATISYTDFNATSYAANDGSHEIGGITFTTANVMKNNTDSKIQFKKSSGVLYNTVALNGLSSVVISSGSNLTLTYGTSSNSGCTHSSIQSGDTFFKIKAGSSTGSCSSITVTFSGTATLSSIDSIDGELTAVVGATSWDLSELTPMGKTSLSPSTAVDISSYVTLATEDAPGSVGSTTVTVTVTPKETGTVTAKNIEVNATVTENPFSKFSKITSVEQITEHDIFGLSVDGLEFASNAISSKTLPLTDDISEVGLFKLESQSTTYKLTLQTESNSSFTKNGYIGNSTSSADLTSSETNDWICYTYGDGVNIKHGSRYIGLNEAKTAIKAYTDTSKYTPVYIYIYDDELLNWSKSFINNLTCDPQGQTAPSVEDWNTLAASFNLLTDEQKTTAKNTIASTSGVWTEVAVEKYDYIISKYNKSSIVYTNFMDRTVSSNLYSAKSLDMNDTNTTIAIVAVVSLIGVSAIGGYFFIRKTKHE